MSIQRRSFQLRSPASASCTPLAPSVSVHLNVAQPIRFFETWSEVPGDNYDNGFKAEWEIFIRHLYEGAPFKWTLTEGAKGVQLAEAGLRSWMERRWIDIPALKV